MPLPTPTNVSPETEPFRVLLYGDPGAGKTTLAASVNQNPLMSPALVLDLDGGLSSVSHLGNVRQVTLKDTNELISILSEFLKPADKRTDGYQDVKTIIIDSVSALRDKVLTDAVETNSKREASKGKPRELMIPQIQDYGQMTYQLSSILHGFRQLPYHLILTAGVEENRSQDGSTLLGATPLLNPKLLQTVNYMMSFIWFAKKKGDESYRLLTLPRGVYTIKTRNPKFVTAIKAETRAQAPDKADAAEGWFDIKLTADGSPTPNISDLYNLYLNSQKGAK